MGTINYKDPTLIATLTANGVMSSSDKNDLNRLDSDIRIIIDALDGYGFPPSLDGYATETYVQNNLQIIIDALDGYGLPPSLDGYATETYVQNNLQLEINRATEVEQQIINALDGYGVPISTNTFASVAIDVSLTTTSNTIIDTRPANPSGINRWKLVSIDVRLKTAITGSGIPSAIFSVGSTSGGQQVVLNQSIIEATAVGTIIGGLALSTLGTDMSQSNGFEAMYPASQELYANVTTSGSVSTGEVTVYLMWQGFP
ncbi:hypothetical protein M0R72_02240 [Candidatus Pacearchaeota archaeon]|jgi:hypothetical protein|nr:hypothetical protein [Candidatus Pacearchaeota archaeon]